MNFHYKEYKIHENRTVCQILLPTTPSHQLLTYGHVSPIHTPASSPVLHYFEANLDLIYIHKYI